MWLSYQTVHYAVKKGKVCTKKCRDSAQNGDFMRRLPGFVPL